MSDNTDGEIISPEAMREWINAVPRLIALHNEGKIGLNMSVRVLESHHEIKDDKDITVIDKFEIVSVGIVP